MEQVAENLDETQQLAVVADCWMTSREAGEYLRIVESTLSSMRKHGRGPRYYRPGYRTVRYRRSDLDAWVESGRVSESGDA